MTMTSTWQLDPGSEPGQRLRFVRNVGRSSAPGRPVANSAAGLVADLGQPPSPLPVLPSGSTELTTEPVPLDTVEVPHTWVIAADLTDDQRFHRQDRPDWFGYLPTYTVDRVAVGGDQRYHISFRHSGDQGRLTVVLRKDPPSSLIPVPAEAEEVPHETVVQLRYEVDGRVVTRDFDEVEHLPARVRCRLIITSRRELIEINEAMNLSDRSARLVVRRRLIVGTPSRRSMTLAQVEDPAIDGDDFDGRLVVTGRRPIPEAGGSWTRYDVALTDRHRLPAELFAPSPDLPPVGLTSSASRTVVELVDQDDHRQYGWAATAGPDDLAELWFARTRPAATSVGGDGRLRLLLTDRRTGKRFRSVLIDPESDQTRSPAPLFDVRHHEFEQSEDFVYPRDLHGYIYVDGDRGLIRHHVDWQGQEHVYLQPADQRNLFYCCPDDFKLARRSGSPAQPHLTAGFVDTGRGAAGLEVQVSYRLGATINPERLQAALEHFEAEGALIDSPADVVFESLATSRDRVRYRLHLPVDGVLTSVERPDISITGADIVDVLPTMSIDDFLLAFDKLIDPGNQSWILAGDITCNLGTETMPGVPVQLLLFDCVGDVVTTTIEIGEPGAAALTVGVTNLVESPVRLTGTPSVSVVADDPNPPAGTGSGSPAIVELHLDDPAAELVIPPGQRLLLTGQRPEELGGPLRLIDPPPAATVEPDGVILYDAIVDPDVPGTYGRPVEVVGFAPLFAGRSQLSAIKIELSADENGGGPVVVAVVERATREEPVGVTLTCSVRDHVLSGGADDGRNGVRATMIDGAGVAVEGEWHPWTGDVLVMTTALLPTPSDPTDQGDAS